MGMRGIHTSINDIRKKVFAEVARLSYQYQDGDLSDMENIPYRIIPGEVSTYRESVFLERAIVKERMRLAMGLPLRDVTEHAPVSQGAEECVHPEKYYQPPLINIIKFACHKCPDNQVVITDQCQGCLAQPCRQVCPRNAINFARGQCHIDPSACIKCGKCMSVCQYGAILRMERPCAVACGMKAIGSDEYGRAEIDQEKCVSCGMCLANCPFGAIADKAQIFQCIQRLVNPVDRHIRLSVQKGGYHHPRGQLGALFGLDLLHVLLDGIDLLLRRRDHGTRGVELRSILVAFTGALFFSRGLDRKFLLNQGTSVLTAHTEPAVSLLDRTAGLRLKITQIERLFG